MRATLEATDGCPAVNGPGKGSLTATDLASFASSFITPEIIKAAKIRRVSDTEGAEIVGKERNASLEYSGIEIPYFSPDNSYPCNRRLRLDHPEREIKDGVEKDRNKYLGHPGQPNRIYFPPGTTLAMLADAEISLIAVEGEKKALAMDRWAKESGRRYLVIGLSGVWGFRGTIGKTPDSSGKKVPVKGLIQDLRNINLRGRDVIIFYDANVNFNDKVKLARQSFARELNDLKAVVLYADLPKDCAVNGPDDYLGKIESEKGLKAAVDAVKKIIDRAKPATFTKTPQSEQLLNIADDIELFHTPDGESFATIQVAGHVETRRLNEKGTREYLARKFYEEDGKPPSSQAMQDAIGVLGGRAQFDGPCLQVHVRCARIENNIYLDLCNDEWQILEISKDGSRVIEAGSAPLRFRRTKGMRELPIPTENGDVSALRELLNLRDVGDECDVGDGAYLLILSWLVTCFRPDSPFPILIITGPPGTAKTTATRLLKELIDPSVTPHRSCPRNEQDLMIAATNAWVCSFDNVSTVPDWLSDAFCRISTGGGFSTRTLYENDDETIFSAKRPIILNGIGSFASRSDLIDRAVVVELRPISKENRKSEREFWAGFERSRAVIFSGLVKAVSIALANIDSVDLKEAPRMADFAEWAIAAETGLGFDKGSFIKAYSRNREGSHAIVLEGSALAEVLQEYCAEHKPANQTLLIKDLLAALKRLADVDQTDLRTKRKDFPKSSKGLRGELQRLDPNLREIGIKVDFLGRTGPNARFGASVQIDYICNPTSQTSQHHNLNKNLAEKGDVSGDVSGGGHLANVTTTQNVMQLCECGTMGHIGLTCKGCGVIVSDWLGEIDTSDAAERASIEQEQPLA